MAAAQKPQQTSSNSSSKCQPTTSHSSSSSSFPPLFGGQISTTTAGRRRRRTPRQPSQPSHSAKQTNPPGGRHFGQPATAVAYRLKRPPEVEMECQKRRNAKRGDGMPRGEGKEEEWRKEAKILKKCRGQQNGGQEVLAPAPGGWQHFRWIGWAKRAKCAIIIISNHQMDYLENFEC
jgi:hypothetical protein